MSSELEVLAVYGLVIILTIVLQVLATLPQYDLSYLVGPRDQTRELNGLAGRLARASTNNVTALAYFAPAVLVTPVHGQTTAAALLAAQIFLFARIVYVGFYALGVPWLRTISWGIGLVSAIYLYGVALL